MLVRRKNQIFPNSSFRASTQGATLIEFVIAFPILLALLFGAIQLMFLVFQKSVLDDAIVDVARKLERSNQICEDTSTAALNSLSPAGIIGTLTNTGAIFMTRVDFPRDGTDVISVPCIDARDLDSNGLPKRKIVLRIRYMIHCVACAPLSLGLIRSSLPVTTRQLLRPESFSMSETCLVPPPPLEDLSLPCEAIP